jgi:predicted transcriptional regulator
MNNEKIKPTSSELEILNILWAKGPSTVREIHEILTQNKEAGYTTTLKLMQIMHEKKMVKRDETSKSHIYIADVSQEKMQGQIVRGMIDGIFNGSASRLVMQALGNHKTDASELNEIRKYLDEIERKNSSVKIPKK